jgi:hypothetical protein
VEVPGDPRGSRRAPRLVKKGRYAGLEFRGSAAIRQEWPLCRAGISGKRRDSPRMAAVSGWNFSEAPRFAKNGRYAHSQSDHFRQMGVAAGRVDGFRVREELSTVEGLLQSRLRQAPKPRKLLMSSEPRRSRDWPRVVAMPMRRATTFVIWVWLQGGSMSRTPRT